MSPERFNKELIKGEDLVKVDLWSLGIILYETIYNKHPFGLEITTVQKTIDEIMNKKLELEYKSNVLNEMNQKK
jgi:serine/threonine protein kinase